MKQLGPIPVAAQAHEGLIIGRNDANSELLRYSGGAHLITLAPSGYGKFTNSLGPNLALYPGSIFCIDPKGQCAAVTARARRRLGQQVHILNPFGIFADILGASASYNPLDWLLSEPKMLVDNAIMLADALVIDEGGKEDHWNEQAKTTLLGMIVHVCTHPQFEGRRNLVTVRNLLQLEGDDFGGVLFDMSENKAAGSCAAGVAGQLAATPPNERGSIISSANRHVRFIASEGLQGVLQSSTFDLTRLKDEHMTVFVFLPAKFLHSHRRWLRMMVTVAMLGATREELHKPAHPVVWMLDELAQLGYLQAVAEGYALLRGYGYRIWGIFQDLPQMYFIYNQRADSMLSSSLVQGFNIQCPKTAEWLSTIAGMHQVGGYGQSGPQFQPVIRPDEVRFLPPDYQLVKLPGERLFTCKKLVSWRDMDFAPFLDPDPYEAR